MSQPHVYLIHADDAPQYLEKMQEILQQFKEEGRITDFHNLSSDAATTLKDRVRQKDLILILLTQEMIASRRQVEEIVSSIRMDQPQLKIIEVVIDNLPYNNDFVTFPSDLRPIRNRKDVNVVWQDIKDKFRQMLPVQQSFWKFLPTLSIKSNENLIYLLLLITAVIALLFPVFAHNDLYGFGLIIVIIIHIFGLYKVFRSVPTRNMIKAIFIITPVIAILSLDIDNRDQDFVLFIISGLNFIALLFIRFKSIGYRINLILIITAVIALLAAIVADNGIFAYTVFLIPIMHIIGLVSVFRSSSEERTVKIIFIVTIMLLSIWFLFALANKSDEAILTLTFFLISGMNFTGILLRKLQFGSKPRT